jgi:hypothetical protein
MEFSDLSSVGLNSCRGAYSIIGPNNDDLPSDWTLATPSDRPFGSQLAERAGAFGKSDAGLGTFADANY